MTDTSKPAGFSKATPLAFLVHDMMVARQPVQAKGRFPEPETMLYPADREDDARAIARMMNGECTPLYAVNSYDTMRDELSSAKAEIERLRRHIEKALQLLEPGSTECGRCDLTIEISNPEAVAELQAALAKQGGSDG